MSEKKSKKKIIQWILHNRGNYTTPIYHKKKMINNFNVKIIVIRLHIVNYFRGERKNNRGSECLLFV